MRHTTVHTPGRLLFIATLVLLSTLAFVSAPAAAGDKVVTVAPASRVENIESPPPSVCRIRPSTTSPL
jgi:hypothetical protein